MSLVCKQLKWRNLFLSEAHEQVLVMAQALLQMAHVSHETQVARLTAPLARRVVIRKFYLEHWSQLRSSSRSLLFLSSRCSAHFEYFPVLFPLCCPPPAHSLSVFQSSLSRDNLEADQPPWWLPDTSPPLSASSNHPWQESRHLTKCRCQGNDLSTWYEQ